MCEFHIAGATRKRSLQRENVYFADDFNRNIDAAKFSFIKPVIVFDEHRSLARDNCYRSSKLPVTIIEYTEARAERNSCLSVLAIRIP